MNTDSYKYLAAVYDKLMTDVDYDAWASYLHSLLLKYGGGGLRILEAACGTGSISLRLSAMGHSLLCTDISPDMLDLAAQNARLKGIGVRFVEQDMRTLSCAGHRDAVIACCDAVNYLTDDADAKAFFDCAYDILSPDGVLLFDISSAYKLKNIVGNEFFFEDSGDVTYFWQNSFEEETQCVKMELTLFLSEGDMYRRFDETHIQRAYTEERLSCLLKESGFGAVYAYSFLTEKPAGQADERIQFVAMKERTS